MELNEVKLEKLKVALQQTISQKHYSDVDIDAYADFLADEFIIRLERFIWTEQLEHYEFSYPANWKEALKERFLPEFLKERYPVKYTYHNINVMAAYPKISLPSQPKKLFIMPGFYEE